MTPAPTLDVEQDAAVHHGGGPALVIAGPGAGKTRVLTHRVAHLVSTGVDPKSIAVCTFTNKATEEMRSRLYTLIGTSTDHLALGTIHSLCYRLLRDGELGDYQVATDGFVNTALSMLLDPCSDRNPHGLDLLVGGVSLRDLKKFVDGVRDALLDPDAMTAGDVKRIGRDVWGHILSTCRSLGQHPPVEEDLIDAYRRFQTMKADKKLVDFEDMSYLLWRSWTGNPALLAKHQDRFQHVLVDEFQDTSWAQLQILRRLAEPQDNLFVVGDVDQGIYGFRNANPQYTLDFADFYPAAKVYRIGTNYRSLPHVVNGATSLILHNTQRIDLPLRPHRDATDSSIEVIEYASTQDEGDTIAKDLIRHHNGDWSSCAVLYRVNSYSGVIELSLLTHGIPYRILGGLPFFGLKPVADMLAYMRVRSDPTDVKAFERAASSPTRYLGRAYFQSVVQSADGGSLLDAAVSCARGRQVSRVQEFLHVVDHLPSSPSAAVEYIRTTTKYDAWFLARQRLDEDDAGDADARRVVSLDALEGVADNFDTCGELSAYADLVVSEARSDDSASRVTLCTVHKAKGLEWPAVYVAGFADGMFPHRSDPGSEEERRIAYVAVTRARDRLVLCVPRSQSMQLGPSPFLAEMVTRSVYQA